MDFDTSSEKNNNENNKSSILSDNVKDILKRRKDKNKKKMKRMNFSTLLPENLEIDNNNNINNTINDNENEDEKMIDNKERNKDMKELENRAQKSYQSIYDKHNNLDINFKAKEIIMNEKNKNNMACSCCKEIFFAMINIISFALFYFSFITKINDDVIYYYFIYPINKLSLILLLVNGSLTSIIIILVKIKQISIFHICCSLIYYMVMYCKYHLTNNNMQAKNYFDPANCHFFVFFIILIHFLGILFILYNIAYYFYLSGQFNNENNIFFGLLINYWESERKIAKLEKYININLDQLITSKGSSHEDNIRTKKKNSSVIWRIIFLGALLLLIHILLMFKKNEVFNCNYYSTGIIYDKNESIIDDNKYCKISKLKGYCYMNALTGFFDTFTDINECDLNTNPKKEKENLINSLKSKDNNKISEKTKIFGFPLTNNKNYYFNELNIINNNNSNSNITTQLEAKINQEIFDVEKNSNNKYEALIDFSDENNPKLKINIEYNEELANNRKKIESKESLFRNVFVVYLSGVSQFYFKNVLTKLSSFISKFSITSPDTDNKLSSNSYQFSRYHSLSNDSFYNYFHMFYDSSINSKELKTNLMNQETIDINDHLKYFQDNGYVTGQSIDTCSNYEHQFKNREIFWDHENLAISCDVNFLENIKNNNYCLYGNPFYTYHINYAMQFWEKYKDNKKYFRLNFNYAHEKSGSLLSYLDQPLYDLFIKLSFNGYLEDTAVFFVSEYGGVQDNILYNVGMSNEKEINMKMGSFLLLLNKNNELSDDENKIVYNNQNKLVTSFDIYASLSHIALGNTINKVKLYLDENNKGESVFKIINGDERKCELYKDYWIDEKYCSCLKEE